MQPLQNVLNALPPETQAHLSALWEALSPTERAALQAALRGMPSERQLMRFLFDMASTHIKTAFGRKHRVAIVGPANVGKSTLYNQFVHAKEDQAVVGPTPGTTRVNQAAAAGPFIVIDTPGADAVGAVGQAERARALRAAYEADFLVIVFDALQGIRQSELALFRELLDLHKPYVVALNKSDLVKRDLRTVVLGAAQNLELKPEQIIAISARNGDNVGRVLMAITVSEPELIAALGSALPGYRWQLATRSIFTAAGLAAVIALTPIPMIDFIPLVITQAVMVVGIGRIYNHAITVGVARELVATFGLGLIGRTLFQELSKLGGVPGWLLSAAIASSTTVAMGYAASVWFERGERVTPEALKRLTAQITAVLLAALRGASKRKLSRRMLQESVEAALAALPLSTERAALDGADAIGP